MTKKSLECFGNFLTQYEKELKTPIADYGGTAEIGSGAVHDILKIVNPKLVQGYEMLDYDNGVDLEKPLKKKYGTGVCMDLLEHARNPFLVAKNISDSLKKGALLFVTAPFVWDIHTHPEDNWNDYWRFTPEGLTELFKDLTMIGVRLERDVYKGETVPGQRVVGVFRK